MRSKGNRDIDGELVEDLFLSLSLSLSLFLSFYIFFLLLAVRGNETI